MPVTARAATHPEPVEGPTARARDIRMRVEQTGSVETSLPKCNQQDLASGLLLLVARAEPPAARDSDCSDEYRLYTPEAKATKRIGASRLCEDKFWIQLEATAKVI